MNAPWASNQAEFIFRDRLLNALRDAGISARKEVSMHRNWDEPYLLRADIVVGERPTAGCEAVVECKMSSDSQSLSTALGQAIIYRRAFGASRAVICFPSSIRLPGLFVEVCAANEVLITSEEDIVDALDAGGRRRVKACAKEFSDWMKREPVRDWPVEQRAIWRERLQPVVDFYNEL